SSNLILLSLHDALPISAYYPQNREAVEAAGDQYGSTSDSAVYNGPFVLTEWDAATGNTWTFAKNDYYWDADNVNLDTVNFQYLRSEEHTSELQSRFDLV